MIDHIRRLAACNADRMLSKELTPNLLPFGPVSTGGRVRAIVRYRAKPDPLALRAMATAKCPMSSRAMSGRAPRHLFTYLRIGSEPSPVPTLRLCVVER